MIRMEKKTYQCHNMLINFHRHYITYYKIEIKSCLFSSKRILIKINVEVVKATAYVKNIYIIKMW